ncbi:MAG: hypothetical protein ACI9XP_001059 [Lentimonas sp.]|jgi:hypothetical protein
MIRKLTFFSVLITIAFLTTTGCNKHKVDNWRTIKKLHKNYKNGEIDECQFNGETVYSAALNATDSGNQIFDIDGIQIGDCNYAWGPVDPMCGELQDCETIYRIEDNIWGRPHVDKYDLGN